MPDLMGGFEYTWPIYLTAVVCYLMGSVPWGLLLTAMAGYGDIRKQGSGSIGATNVLRTGNKMLAAVTVLLDAGKGWAATFFAWQVGGPDFAVVAAVAVVLGHMFPVWLKFRGGKGVATGAGVLLGLAWLPFLICCGVWLLVVLLTRISSVAGMASAVAAPIAMWFVLHDMQYVQATGLIAILIVLRHHANIARLLKGQEPRIGRKGP
ncbi:MAG: glycerol-3-phosphate 1-O-acyltransferase PlsY [Proteobacteria bacterium]|nr:glycerol-3-phosphate 1-O-acyltransferase PlsY [Pseudomonadota bacterium]MDA1070456.1 glycerol-3-phosphate 1-O-acyltransferase PlsY [Pseudomonadota bacterium]